MTDNTKIDYKKKYLDSFFKWQDICALQRKQIEEIEKKNKELENEIEKLKHLQNESL